MSRARWIVFPAVVLACCTCAVPAGAAPRAAAAIINGTTAASAGSAAFIRARVGDYVYSCTGSVVAPNVVLTAAHCTQDENGTPFAASAFTVRTGARDWTDTAAGQTSSVLATVVHPAWNPQTLRGDAALLELAAAVQAPPIPLAGANDTALLTIGRALQAYGWGVTQTAAGATPSPTLQTATLALQRPSYCGVHAYELGGAFDSSWDVCAVDTNVVASPCHGDSGGPLVTQRADGTAVQIGVTSWGAANCAANQPGYFTRVDAIAAWASSTIAGFTNTSPPAVTDPPAALTTDAAPNPTTPTPTPRVTTRYAAQTSGAGYISATTQGRRLTAIRIRKRLTCKAKSTLFDLTWQLPNVGSTWLVPTAGGLTVTLRGRADRTFFAGSAKVTVDRLTDDVLIGHVTVTQRARARKTGRCTGTVRSFTLRRR